MIKSVPIALESFTHKYSRHSVEVCSMSNLSASTFNSLSAKSVLAGEKLIAMYSIST